jgi:hypothetical protein
MNKSNLSKPSQPPTLPPELLLVIIELLCHKDQKRFCLLSHSSRRLALPSVFSRITYSQYLVHCIKRLNTAREDVKAAIKFVRYHYQTLLGCLNRDSLNQGIDFDRRWLGKLGLRVDPLPFLEKPAKFAVFSME